MQEPEARLMVFELVVFGVGLNEHSGREYTGTQLVTLLVAQLRVAGSPEQTVMALALPANKKSPRAITATIFNRLITTNDTRFQY